ncbi:MAG: type II secretion system protein GspK [Bacteriovoracaceae bacterium]
MKIKIRQILMNNNRGAALLMVMTAVSLLTVLLADFTYETKLNKIKIYNQQDKAQAKLNAEAALMTALARLSFYKEVRNYLEKNPDLKKQVDPKSIDFIYSMPFIFPIVLPKDANIMEKGALSDFQKYSLLKGSFQVSIDNAANLMNVNLLRVSKLKKKNEYVSDLEREEIDKKNKDAEGKNESTSGDEESGLDDLGDKEDPFNTDKRFGDLLTTAFNHEMETNEDFRDANKDVDPLKLIQTLKYYVSDKNSNVKEQYPDAVSLFEQSGISPKFAPLSSITEIHSVPGFTDEIFNLIRDEITVHGSVFIDVNKLTEKGLKNMFPNIDEEQSKAFFDYRDNTEDPHYFQSLKEFRDYIVNQARIVSSVVFERRMKEFAKAGIKFGTSSTLFRVLAQGEFNNAKYSITAFVTLPAKPLPKDSKKNANNEDQGKKYDDFGNPIPEDKKNKNGKAKKSVPPLELLDPEVVEISVNI